MSGEALRSPCFGEGLTSATTEDSGRNWDETIRERSDALRELRSRPGRTRRLCRMGAATQAAALEPSRIKRRDVRTGLSPVRTSTPGPIWSPIYDTLLHNTSRTRSPTLAPHAGGTGPGRSRPRRHSRGRRAAGRAGRPCRRRVVLEVRRVLELILGPSHFELGHGRIITAGGY